MALEDRIRSSVDTALNELTARVDQDVRAIVQQLIAAALDERDEALDAARRAALDEAREETKRQVDEADARVRAAIDRAVEEARSDERTTIARDMRHLVEAEAEQKVAEALAAAEERVQLALADADAKTEQRVKESVTDACVRERESEMAAFTRLLESIRGLDGATSLSEVLDALGQAAGREASRAAVLVLRNERLIAWRLSGFGPHDAQPKTIDCDLHESGVIGLAITAARPVSTRDNKTAGRGPAFAHLPPDRLGFAVPVIVGGRVVAVIYADTLAGDGREHMVPSGWPEVIEVLARHAARCLEALSMPKAAPAPQPRFWVPAGGRPSGSEAQTKPSADPAPSNGPGVPPGINP